MRRTLLLSLPLFFACSSSEPASPTFAGEIPRDGGATFLDGADGTTSTTPPNDAGPDVNACPTFVGDSGTDGAVPPALVTAMTAASPGDIVSLSGLDENAAPALTLANCPMTQTPTLLFSDSPENPDADGVLYADTVNAGSYRLYVYQTNGGNQQRKFPIVVVNPAMTAAKVTITRSGLVAAPAKSYVAIGKAVVADWLTDKTAVVVDVLAQARVLLDVNLDARLAQKDELVHAIYDVTTDAQLKFSFVSIAANGNAVVDAAGFSVLPADGTHQRGTFPNAEVTVRAATGAQQKGIQRIRLGGGGIDAPLSGSDRTVDGGAPQTLVGNFGMLYRIELGGPIATTARAGISARGGAWGGVMRNGATNTLLPAASEALATSTDAIVIGPIDATTKLRLMTAGGSNLPIDLFLVTP